MKQQVDEKRTSDQPQEEGQHVAPPVQRPWSSRPRNADNKNKTQQAASQSQGNQQVQSPHQQKPGHMSNKLIIAIIGAAALIITTIITIYRPGMGNQPEPSSTPTPIISPTLPPPKVTITSLAPPSSWEQVIDDPLKTNSIGWFTGSNTTGDCEFTNGAYQVTTPQRRTNWSHRCTASATEVANNFTNFAFEVQMTIVKGDEGGMIFRCNVRGVPVNFYYFHISQTGSYTLDIYENNMLYKMLDQGRNAAIHTGLNQPNIIAVVAQGSTFHLYVNKQLINTVTDPESSYGHGQIGLVADAKDHPPTEVLFSNVKVWIPRPEN